MEDVMRKIESRS